MKVVTDMKIFGSTICTSYRGTLEETWKKVMSGFRKILFSWQARQLKTLAQREHMGRTFE